MEGVMNRTTASVVLAVSVVFLAVGLLFLCAASRQPTRLFLAIALLVIGGGLAAWSGLTLRRLWELDPEHLSDRITALARAGGQAEVTLSQVVAELNVPDEAALESLALLESREQCYREDREGREFYVFPGLEETKVVRRCAYCGNEFSVKTPLHKCPDCGGELELARE
jgi:hypothetical protein